MIVFYESQKQVWFTKDFQYENLVPTVIFFSNYDKWLDTFENEEEQELKDLIIPWLPKRESSDNNTTLYIPSNMKEKFIRILNLLGFKTETGNIDSLPNSEQLGLAKDEERSVFYDNLEKKEVFLLTRNRCMPTETNDKTNPLQKRMDEITNEKNEIDAVFVADNTCVIAKSELSTDPKRKVDADDINICLGNILTGLPDITDLGKGNLEYALLQIDEGIICISMVPGTNDRWLGFISATYEGAPRLLAFRKRYLEELHKLAISNS